MVFFTPLGPRWNRLHYHGACACNPQQPATKSAKPWWLVSRRDHGAVHRNPPASHRCDHCGSCVFYISPWSLCAPTQATCSPIVSIALVWVHSGTHAQHRGGVVCPRATVARGSQLQWLRRQVTVSAAGESDATVACSQPRPWCSTSCVHCASTCPHCGACCSCIPP